MPLFKELKGLGMPNIPKFPKSPKNLLENLAEKIDAGIKKAEEKVSGTIQEGKKLVEGAAKTVIAVEEAGYNVIKGKSAEEVVTEFTETISSKGTEQLTKTIIKHQSHHAKEQKSKISTVPNSATITSPQTLHIETSPSLAPPLLILRDVLHIYDGRRGDGPESNRARKYSRFAAHSYGDLEDSVLPEGCKRVECHDTFEGLKAVVYCDHNDIICAFAGSKKIKDWENNFTQLVGASKQYEEALEYALYLKSKYPDKSIIFVGHSQGGGEAAYCAYNLGLRAETYNPAGLSIFTKFKSECKIGAHINAYVFSTDIFNALQNAIGIETDGEVHYVQANIFQHGAHGIKGILRYFKIWYKKIKKKGKKKS